MKNHCHGQPACSLGLLLILGLTGALPAAADKAKGYHLWYDENGQAVYSQFSPENGQPSERVKPPPPPAESPEVARQRLQQQIQRLEDNREDKALAEEKTTASADQAAQAKARCETARKNLAVLQGRPRQLYQKPDGTVVRMDEQERERQRAEMEKIIAADCN